MQKLIYICSPCRGNYKANIENAIAACAAMWQLGYIPIAPHIYFTRFADDRNPKDRARAMRAAKVALAMCDEVWVLGEPTEGMMEEIAFAERCNIPVYADDLVTVTAACKPDGEHELSPHRFVEKEVIHNATVQILECSECGELSVGWQREQQAKD